MMEQRLLTAFRLCGEIDIDGNEMAYGAEVDDSDENGDHGEDSDGNNSDDSARSIRIKLGHFPVKKQSKKGGEIALG